MKFENMYFDFLIFKAILSIEIFKENTKGKKMKKLCIIFTCGILMSTQNVMASENISDALLTKLDTPITIKLEKYLMIDIFKNKVVKDRKN